VIPLLLAILLGVGMLVAAVALLFSREPATMILLAGAVGLLASVFYLLLAAPDVAMTEAAIGAGLSSGILFYGLHKIRSSARGNEP
jgi:energy-converting hydrogenase B subunit D